MTSDGRDPWPFAGAELPRRTITARERVAAALRERILAGALQDGYALNLDMLAQGFGTSRTPVREACMDLAKDGLVEIAPRSGITVRGLTPETVVENFAIMAVLSAAAAEWAAERITPAELDRARELAVEVAIAVRNGKDVDTPNWMFHREVNRACKSPRLLAMLGGAGRLIPQSFFNLFPEHAESSLDEHEALLEAVARRDGRQAAEVTRLHLREAAELVSKQAAELSQARPLKVRDHV
jgi:DNA-binding GntR family transcriptional regulator